MRLLPRRQKLAREISLILTVKLLLLTGLWFAFFRDPPPQTDTTVSQHILSSAPLHGRYGSVPARESAIGIYLHRGPRLFRIGDLALRPIEELR